MDGSDMQNNKPATEMFDPHFKKTMEALGQASLSVRAEKDRMIKLVEDRLEDLQKRKALENSSKLTACKVNAENESATMNSSRPKRKAAQIGTLKLKNNLKPLFKPGLPTISDDIDVPMGKTRVPLAEVTNGQSRTTSTRKFNRSEAPHRPDMDALNQKQQREVNAPVDNVADDNNQPSTSYSQPSASGPLFTMKLRTKQFKNLAVKTEESVKKTHFGILNNNEKPVKQDRNGTFVVQPVPRATAANSTASCSALVIAENESRRVTRAMAKRYKLLISDEATTSEETASSRKSSRTSGKKRSSVTVKCKRSFKNAKLERSLEKKTKLKGKKKDIRRDREEKLNKAAKEAVLRKQEEAKAAQEKKAEKIRAIAAEREKFLKEEEAKKAAIAKQKKLQVEEQRKREEAAHRARLEETVIEFNDLSSDDKQEFLGFPMLIEPDYDTLELIEGIIFKEEEQKRAEAAIQKNKEQTEALRQKELAQEIKTTKPLLQDTDKPTAPNMNKEKLAKGKNTQAENRQITPNLANRVLENPENAQNYGIDEVCNSDSSDYEDRPKKRIPAWAERKNRMLPIKINSYVPLEEWNELYKPDEKPDIKKLLGVDCNRARTSSAIWTTPKLLK